MKLTIIYKISILFLLLIGIFSCKQKIDNPTHIITHEMGNSEVPIKPKRIVTLTTEATEAMLILGIKPVGRVKPNSYYLKNQVSKIEEVGYENNVDIDKVSALQPDLIFGTKSLHKEIYKKLSFLAPTIFVNNTNGNLKYNFIKYAESINKVYYGNQVLIDYNNKLTKVKNIIKSNNLVNKKISFISFFPNKTYYLSKSTSIDSLLKELNLKQVKKNNSNNYINYIDLSKNDFLDIVKESNIIFYFTYDDKSKARQISWFSHPTINNLKLATYQVNTDIHLSNGILTANIILSQLEINLI